MIQPQHPTILAKHGHSARLARKIFRDCQDVLASGRDSARWEPHRRTTAGPRIRPVNNLHDPLIATLETTGVDYEIVNCDPDLADTAAFCQAYGYAMEDSANTIVVVGKSVPPTYAACVVLANTRLDVNKTVRKKLGTRKASFASGDDTEALTGMTIGGVTPFTLPEDLPIWVDARVMERDRIILGGGGRDRKVLAPPDILLASGAEVIEDLARESAGNGP